VTSTPSFSSIAIGCRGERSAASASGSSNCRRKGASVGLRTTSRLSGIVRVSGTELVMLKAVTLTGAALTIAPIWGWRR
jgi:hypothetical protein